MTEQDTTPRHFTAAEVRALAHACTSHATIKAMLLAFAERLDVDALEPELSEYVDALKFEQAMKDAVEGAKEEGRREVLREVAKLAPVNAFSNCTFCDGGYRVLLNGYDHTPSCLWLRAQSALESRPNANHEPQGDVPR